MARAKKRYTVMFENVNGSGSLGTFTKINKAESWMESCKRDDKKDIMNGYTDLQNRYWIEESVVY